MDVVIVNTCGFLDSAKIERLEAIGEALDENGRVIVTGCLGADENAIRDVHPDRFSVSRPHQYETVIVAVHEAAPPVAKAERPMDACVQELLLVSQDTGAYGTDLKYAKSSNKHWATPARITELCRVIGSFGAWVQLHLIYPYRHIDDLIPLMAEGVILPYLDIPYKHASPKVLKAM